MADGPERTAQEREAARLDRERRRQGGVFNDPDEGTVDEPAPADVADPPVAYEDDAGDVDAGDVDDHAAADGYGDEPDRYDGAELSDDEAHEMPSGTRRVSRLQAGPTARRQRTVQRKRRAAPARKGHSWAGRILSLVALILGAALIWFLLELFQPFGTSPHGHVTVVVPNHSGTDQVGNLLVRDGVISSALFFELRATLAGERSDLRAGTYRFQQGMSYGAVLAALTKAPKAAKTTQLTISEGHTRQYVAQLLRQQGIKGNYLAATRSSPLLNPHAYGAPRHVPSLEGFLFPDTFSLVDPIKISRLVADQLRDFKQRFAAVNLGYAGRKHLTGYDVLKIASLIEAEAASNRARPLVASVIYNRLADNMMLQFDSTARYATGNFTKPLTESQLNSRSPYNTHTHFGLPPTPIDSPGVASIQAAAHPARTRYLYFFSKPCTNNTVFATSYTQFLNLLARDKRTHCS
ncbi:MAG TPA: endolytic transglycosylase MltG [Solirubrobacteraceae bacterium]|nr:endolytic transglycosylase MltG [Solirubrobacteraceae bacterium]